MGMKIERYSFGSMRIEGNTYDRDVIVFPDRIVANWWRRSGHSLAVEDLREVIAFRPQSLVIGTGALGVMNVPESTLEIIRKAGIAVTAIDTHQAVNRFNQEIANGMQVVGAFHITC